MANPFETGQAQNKSGQVRWVIRPPWERRREAAIRWQVPELLAQLLHNRGIGLDNDPAEFLAPRLTGLIDPDELPGATAAARLLAEAVVRKQKIVLYGDYDVDGITGVACLWHVLAHAGADVSYYVPHRLDEGYGLNAQAVAKLAKEGAHVIVSVDCGVTAVDEARLGTEAGVQMIITDHHTPGPKLPEAAAVVHPAIGGSYPNADLCGAGVAFKLGWALARQLCGSQRVSEAHRAILMDNLCLAALGTIADVVPLTGENRIIARHGLARICEANNAGLEALIESAGLTGQHIGGYEVGFRLAPRLNAAGRMGHAQLAVELLTRADENRAREISLYLEEHNRARQSKERKIFNDACQMVEARGMNRDHCRGIVLCSEGWHAGVVGIVAARIADKFRRPTVMIALENGHGQGSARSVEHFHLHEALTHCAEHLERFGGHAMAAGMKIRSDRVDAFSRAFVERANLTLTGADLTRKLHLDAAIELTDLSLETVQAITDLGPFGRSNPRPKLATDWVELMGEPRCVGKSAAHMQATFRQNGTVLRSIGFGQAAAAEDLKQHRKCRIAFEPSINEYNGRRSVELNVLDFQFPDK